MSRSRRIILVFALAVLGPAAVLAGFAFRSVRAEAVLRRGEREEKLREFLAAARRDIEADLEARVEAERRRLAATLERGEKPPEVVTLLPDDVEPDVPALEESVRRERPDLLGLLAEARGFEFQKQDPARAAGLYLELWETLENPATRARLRVPAARNLVRAGKKKEAERVLVALAEEHGGTRGESMLPLGVVARLQLLDLATGEDRDRIARELLDTSLDPISELVVLRKLEERGVPGPLADRGERADRRLQALVASRTGAEHGWLAGPTGAWAWLNVSEGDRSALCVVPVGSVPGEATRRRLDELAAVAGLTYDVRAEPDPTAELHERIAGGALRVSAQASDTLDFSGSRAWLLGGLVALLLVAMTVGFAATVRAVGREMALARLKSDFISNVSHEVRTPIASVRMFSELLTDPRITDPAKRAEHAELLRREAGRLSALVERLLDFARLERGARSLRLETRDLVAVVEEAVRNFRSPRPEFRVPISRPERPLPVRVDAEAFEQVVHNLLDNAAKYSPERDEACVALSARNGSAVLEVRDRGTGIDPQDLPHLFETFYRGRNPLTLPTPGSGLGLAIVRQIVEAHGGRVRVESQPGKGSAFIVELPLESDRGS